MLRAQRAQAAADKLIASIASGQLTSEFSGAGLLRPLE